MIIIIETPPKTTSASFIHMLLATPKVTFPITLYPTAITHHCKEPACRVIASAKTEDNRPLSQQTQKKQNAKSKKAKILKTQRLTMF